MVCKQTIERWRVMTVETVLVRVRIVVVTLHETVSFNRNLELDEGDVEFVAG